MHSRIWDFRRWDDLWIKTEWRKVGSLGCTEGNQWKEDENRGKSLETEIMLLHTRGKKGSDHLNISESGKFRRTYVTYVGIWSMDVSVSVLWEFILGPHARPTKLESVRLILETYFTKFSRWFFCILKFELAPVYVQSRSDYLGDDIDFGI